MTDPLTLYKLIVLYMLDQVDFPLTKAQIFDFILEKEYTNYFTLQQVTCELIDTGLVESNTLRNSSHLKITEEGRNTLYYFKGRISDGIKADIHTFFRDNELELRNEVSIQSSYYKATTGEYVAELTAKETHTDLLNIKITMPTEEAASNICENWQKKNQDIYAFLMENLL
ncbi:MAG TPA: DUF4364 family protein [Lachnospiraceae bacterium]|nr:DUF4364 family protein [Lachnospiraceae bacterium]